MSNRWSILSVLFLARMTMAFQFQSVAALAPLVAEGYGASLADIGLLIGLYLAPGMAIAIPGGAIAARFGERRVVAAAMVLMLLGGALMSLGATWEALVAGRLLAGIGGVIVNVVMTKMLTDWFVGREISTAMAIYINSWPVGIAAALVILPLIATSAGLAMAWNGVLVLIAAGLLLFVLGYRAPAGAAVAGLLGKAGRVPFGPVFLAGTIWALYNCALAMVFSFGPALLNQRGWSLTAASSTTSIVLWLVAVSVPLGGILADRSGRRDGVMVVSLFGFAMLLVAAVYVPLWAVPTIFVVLGLVSGLAAGPIMSLPSLVLRPQTRAFGMGCFFTIYYVAFMLMPIVAGWLADLSGNVGAAFLLGTTMLFVCVGALALFRRACGQPAVALLGVR